jgi:CheY-like chemotaxis protein
MTRLLFVDDDPAWRALYRMTFEGHFEILEATDAQQALSVLERVTPDVILMDLRMPKMDGIDLIRRLGQRGVQVPIVVCSGALGDGERPVIPGVRLAPKTPHLRELWAALRAAVPKAESASAATAQVGGVEDNYWRD